jgi:hypothetical protein
MNLNSIALVWKMGLDALLSPRTLVDKLSFLSQKTDMHFCKMCDLKHIKARDAIVYSTGFHKWVNTELLGNILLILKY